MTLFVTSQTKGYFSSTLQVNQMPVLELDFAFKMIILRENSEQKCRKFTKRSKIMNCIEFDILLKGELLNFY